MAKFPNVFSLNFSSIHRETQTHSATRCTPAQRDSAFIYCYWHKTKPQQHSDKTPASQNDRSPAVHHHCRLQTHIFNSLPNKQSHCTLSKIHDTHTHIIEHHWYKGTATTATLHYDAAKTTQTADKFSAVKHYNKCRCTIITFNLVQLCYT